MIFGPMFMRLTVAGRVLAENRRRGDVEEVEREPYRTAGR